MKRIFIAFLVLFFVKIVDVKAFINFDGFEEKGITCAYELKTNNDASINKEFLSAMGINTDDGSELTYNSIILYVSYPFLGIDYGDISAQIAMEYKPYSIGIYHLDMFERLSEIHTHYNTDIDTERGVFFRNNGLNGAEQWSVESDYFSDNVIGENYQYNIQKALYYKIGNKYNDNGYNDKIKKEVEEAFCGKRLHLMSTTLKYDWGEEFYIFPFVCGKMKVGNVEVDVCPQMKTNWEMYAARVNKYFPKELASIKNSKLFELYYTNNLVFDTGNSDIGLEEKFEDYFKYCNFSEANKDNYDADTCRGIYTSIKGTIDNAVENFGYEKNELLKEIIETKKTEYENCDWNNNSSECQKKSIDYMLSKFEKTEVILDRAEQDACQKEKFYCEDINACKSEAEELGISESDTYCTEMCKVYRSVCNSYGIAGDMRDDFDPFTLSGIGEVIYDFFTGAGICNSYLGSVDNKNAPAYYLQFLFDLIKYAAIILLFVLGIIDFIRAVATDVNTELKKASTKFIKRLIIVIVIYFLPDLLVFLLRLLGIVDATTCDIR